MKWNFPRKRPSPRRRPKGTPEEPRHWFVDAIKQINYSLFAVLLVTSASVGVEYYKFTKQIRYHEIEKLQESIPQITEDAWQLHKSLIEDLKKYSRLNAGDGIEIMRNVMWEIPETRRHFITLHAKVAAILGEKEANRIIDLTPLLSPVDHSERVSCTPEYSQKLRSNHSLFFLYYDAACAMGGASVERSLSSVTRDASTAKQIPPYEMKNLDLVYDDLAEFEKGVTEIEHLLLNHLEEMKSKW